MVGSAAFGVVMLGISWWSNLSRLRSGDERGQSLRDQVRPLPVRRVAGPGQDGQPSSWDRCRELPLLVLVMEEGILVAPQNQGRRIDLPERCRVVERQQTVEH